NRVLTRRSKKHRYSITSSARASSLSGIAIPSVFAVLRLITNWNFIDCTTGKSAGLSPLSTCRAGSSSLSLILPTLDVALEIAADALKLADHALDLSDPTTLFVDPKLL